MINLHSTFKYDQNSFLRINITSFLSEMTPKRGPQATIADRQFMESKLQMESPLDNPMWIPMDSC